MRMYTKAFNSKREATDFINAGGLTKDDIVAFFQEKDGLFTVVYYAE